MPSSPHEEVLVEMSKKVPAQLVISNLQAVIPHKISMLADKVDFHSTMAVEASIFPDMDKIADTSEGQDVLTERIRVSTHIENTNVSSPGLPTFDDDSVSQPTQGTSNNDLTEQKGELITQGRERPLEQGEECSKPSLLLCVRLKDIEADKDVGDGVPSRFLSFQQLADVINQLQDQDRTLIRTKRAELAISPSKEKLTILDNIYSVIYQWERTLWAYDSEQMWNPGLVFSTIEAARVGDEEVKKVLRSKNSGARLLICCEAICELIHAFPPENLVPREFVEKCLLAAGSVKADAQDWVQRKFLTMYQDVDSALFWDSLTRHAAYLVMHDLATAKQIASIFTGILLPASRLKDTVKETYESARVNLHIFIVVLLSTKDVSAPCSSDVKGCYIPTGPSLDCDCMQVALYKHDSQHEVQERRSSDSLPLVEMPILDAEEEQAKDELSTTPAKHASTPLCLSCSMLVKCLPWKKSK